MNPKLNLMNIVNQIYFIEGGGGILFGTCIKKNQFDQ